LITLEVFCVVTGQDRDQALMLIDFRPLRVGASRLSGPSFVLALAGIRRLVVQIKATEKDGLLSL
jgi:hypothetical protein